MKKTFLACLILMFGTSVVHAATAQEYINAGNQFYQAKDLNKAILYYKAAVQMDPNNAAAHQSLGSAYYGLGQKAEALAEYEKALAINPNNPQLSSFAQSLRAQVGSSPAMPGTGGAPSASSSSKIIIAPMAGVGYCTSTGYGVGFGGGASVYFPAGGDMSFGASAGYYTFGGPSGTILGISYTDSIANIEALAVIKYFIGQGSMRPYLVGGAGLSLFSETISLAGTSSSGSTTNPMVVAGGGLQFNMGQNMDFFIETRGSIIIGSGGTVSYVPFTAGIALGI